MTVPEAGRRRFAFGAIYVLLCTGLAACVTQGIAPSWSFFALVLLLLPFSIVGFVLFVNVLVSAGDGIPAGWTGTFVVVVAVLACAQVWIFRTMAHNWHRSEVEMRREPVTAGPDSVR